MMARPDLDEVLWRTFERVEHALRQADEAYMTDDSEDSDGNPIDPIHRYAEAMVKNAVPIATLGLFLVLARMNGVKVQ